MKLIINVTEKRHLKECSDFTGDIDNLKNIASYIDAAFSGRLRHKWGNLTVAYSGEAADIIRTKGGTAAEWTAIKDGKPMIPEGGLMSLDFELLPKEKQRFKGNTAELESDFEADRCYIRLK